MRTIEQLLGEGWLRAGRLGTDASWSLAVPACDLVGVPVDTKLAKRRERYPTQRVDDLFIGDPGSLLAMRTVGFCILCYRN